MTLSPARLSTWCVALIALALAFAASPASAQQPTQAQANAVKQSCRSDYMSYCSSVPTGGRASLQCLQEHLIELSPACQSAVSAAEGGAAPRPPANASAAARPPAAAPPAAPPPAMPMREEAALLRHSCSGDFRSYCSNVSMGGGRAIACLAENEQRLSPSCKGALAQARGAR